MSDQDTIFSENANSEPTKQDEVKQETTSQEQPDLLNMFKREDGSLKYKSTEDAFKALQHAQEHISKLERENGEYRSEIEKRKSVEDSVQTLMEQSQVNLRV